MVDQREKYALALVRGLYYATDGKPVWWSLPREMNDVAKDALDCAVDHGWLLLLGSHSVCLTDSGRDLVDDP
jgi:hypothetical protein